MGLEVATEQKVLIKGDNRSASIAAASILAKVARDARLREWDRIYPQYGLGRNKGYATPEHLQALRRYGPSPLHRMSFAPVRESVSWGARAEQTALGLAATGSYGTSPI
jgi:ribonuclease HII